MPQIWSILIVVALGVMFLVVTYLNKNTPKPTGTEHIKAQCESCKATTCPSKIMSKLKENVTTNKEEK